MRINNNLMAMNTHRQLGAAGANGAKSMEKLSSGFRINKAGDDAAGLAISEKMRGQIRGLNQASRNAQDGISMIQTAEGALQESHAILQRMRELAVQSSNDTNVSVDRGEIQKEMDELAKEVTRIANNTEFNTQKLINGGIKDDGIKSAKFHVGANSNQDITLSINAMDAKSLGVSRDVSKATISAATDVTSAELSGTLGTALTDGASLSLTANATAAKTAWTAGALGITGTSLESTANSSQYNDYTITVTKTGGAGADVTAAIDNTTKKITINYSSDVAAGASTAAKLNTALTGAGIALTATGDATAVAGAADAAATTAGLAADEVRLTIGSENVVVKNTATSATFTSAANKGLTVNLDGSLTAATAATIAIEVDAATAATFAGGEKTADANAAAGIDVSTQSAASSAITTIQTAIETVSAERSKLGAYQNRLEHTIKNLDTASENLQASESRIRDVDMAKEMMEFTKNNILQQAAQAMLAQANQAPQGVLQLLR
ncbi:flagellin [Serpentinicella alkaliphila]|uniref:Flagellin n=1 Tax=Serpentinicella alkaliphila TaxID=1734049 RepID=A0A4R2TN86_9FIRM|nr:flagellin [Serpentinicella alkaliphila]QUH24923.1 flagellin [Serpentinicella alkaliphila]TCQ02725.1 flagellin [Serpentinicella alkaliphila]